MSFLASGKNISPPTVRSKTSVLWAARSGTHWPPGIILRSDFYFFHLHRNLSGAPTLSPKVDVICDIGWSAKERRSSTSRTERCNHCLKEF